MSFLNPFFLIGLAALSVPLLIHFINLRKPQSLPFSTLAFFEKLQKSTIRRLRIKRYFLLFLRCAAIILLALALARPFLPSSLVGGVGSQQPRAVALLIDNSPSMGQIDKNGPFMEQAKEAAIRFIKHAREADRFIVEKTNGNQMQGQMMNASAALQMVNQINLEKKGTYLAGRLTSLRDQLRQSEMRRYAIYAFTDAQRTQWKQVKKANMKISEINAPPIGIQIVKIGQNRQQNVAITDIELQSRILSRGRPAALNVQVKNFADAPAANQFLSLEMEGAMEGQYQTDIPSGGTKEFVFQYIPEKSGNIKGKVILEGDPVTFDNKHYFTLEIPSKRSALLVQNTQKDDPFSSYLPVTLQAAEKTTSPLQYERVSLSELSGEDWKNKEVVIFDGVEKIPEYLFSELQQYVQSGHGLVFFPSEKGKVRNYNRFLELFNAGRFGGIRGEYGQFDPIARLARLQEGHPIINQLFVKKEQEDIKIDRPAIFFNYKYDPTRSGRALTILSTSIDDPLLVEQEFGDGRVIISTIGTDPGWSNFPVNPLFAPVFYRSILYAASSEKGGVRSHTLGTPFTWKGALPQPVATLKQGEETVKPEITPVSEGYRVFYQGRSWSPGWLHLTSEDFEKTFALNLSQQESDFSPFTESEADTILGGKMVANGYVEMNSVKGSETIVAEAGLGQEIWHWFMWAALILLLIESFLSRWYKAESV